MPQIKRARVLVSQFEFFPQILADLNADFAEIISVYLRKHLRYQREKLKLTPLPCVPYSLLRHSKDLSLPSFNFQQ